MIDLVETCNTAYDMSKGLDDKLRRRSVFCDVYGIPESILDYAMPTSADGRLANPKQSIHNIAQLILFYSLGKGHMDKFQALQRINTYEISLAFPYHDDFNTNLRNIGTILTRMKEDVDAFSTTFGMRQKGIELKPIDYVRITAYRDILGNNLTTNLEKAVHAWGNNVEFSPFDLLMGYKVPAKIDETAAFLLGVYSVDGKTYRHNKKGRYDFNFTGKTEDTKFYKDILLPMIRSTFNIDAVGRYKPYPSFCIASQMHYTWLTNIIGEGTNNQLLELGSIPEKNRSADMKSLKTHYFFGCVAGLMLVRDRSTGTYPLVTENANHIDAIRQLADELGFTTVRCPVDTAKDPRYLSVSRRTIDDWMQNNALKIEYTLRNGESFEIIPVNPRKIDAGRFTPGIDAKLRSKGKKKTTYTITTPFVNPKHDEIRTII